MVTSDPACGQEPPSPQPLPASGGGGALSVLVHPISIAAAAYAVLALMALASEQVLWADGAYFAYVAGLPDPWAIFWQDFPARIGGGLLSSLPAWAAGRLGLGAVAVGVVYQVTWLLLAPALLALAWRLLPAERRDWFGVVLVFWAAAAMPTFAFPTELWLTAALFWPLFFAALFRRPGHLAARLILTPFFVFTHETMVLLVPVLLAATWWPTVPAPRGERLGLMAWLAGLTAAMVLVSLTSQPENALQVPAVAGNTKHFLSPLSFIRAPMLGAGAAALALFLAALRVRERQTAENLAIVTGLLLAGVLAMALSKAWFPFAHYMARVGIAYGLPLVALALWRFGPVVEPRRVLMFLAPLALAQLVYHVDVNRGWLTYRETLRAELLQPSARPLIDMDASRLAALYQTPRQEINFAWRWALPYQSLVLRLPGDPERQVLVYDQDMWFVPVTCAQTPLLAYDGPAAADLLPALAAHVCRMNP